MALTQFLMYSRWAMQEGYGAKLIRTPALIKDIVRQTVSRVPGLPVSIKIRIHDDARYTEISFSGSLFFPRTETLTTRVDTVLDIFIQLKSLFLLPYYSNMYW